MRRFSRVLAALAALLAAGAAVPAPITPPNFAVAPTARDGRADFNFELGAWRTHYRLLKHRLAGDHEWYDYYGTSVVRSFWNGAGNLEDGDLKCPDCYIGGMTIRFYKAKTHQWSLWWGTRALGVAPPQQVGHFDAGRAKGFRAAGAQPPDSHRQLSRHRRQTALLGRQREL